MGGLGNQMFQYAAGRSLSQKLNTGLKLDVEDYKWGRYKLHKYCLDKLSINTKKAGTQEIKKLKFKTASIIERISFKFENKERERGEKSYKNMGTVFDRNFFNLNDDLYIEGYWQSEKYFIDIKDIILGEFILKKPAAGKNLEHLKTINKTESVSLHIRRGDYINNEKTKSLHGIDLKLYYENAVNLIKKSMKNPYFFIFSDEPDWVRENFRGEFKFTVVDCNTGRTGYEDMRLMSACKHNIIANSSFSWWGAWLNQNPEKIVTAPKNWFTDKSIDTTDLIPENWIRL